MSMFNSVNNNGQPPLLSPSQQVRMNVINRISQENPNTVAKVLGASGPLGTGQGKELPLLDMGIGIDVDTYV